MCGRIVQGVAERRRAVAGDLVGDGQLHGHAGGCAAVGGCQARESHVAQVGEVKLPVSGVLGTTVTLPVAGEADMPTISNFACTAGLVTPGSAAVTE